MKQVKTRREFIKIASLSAFSLVFANVVGCGGGGGSSAGGGGGASPASANNISLVFGLNFSPYMDGQSPNWGTIISEDQLRMRMKIIAPYTEWIRTFGCTNGLEKAGSVAHSLNLKAAIGAWLSADLAANEREISNLIAAAKSGFVDIAIVGSEVLLRGDLTESQLTAYMRRVKTEVPAIPVTTADVYGELLAHPALVPEVDVVFANYYPYWEGIELGQAMAAIHGWHQRVKAYAKGKNVVVSETGWPSGGNTVGKAVPSPENAAFYFINFISWAKANGVQYMYFSAFDEAWKINEGPQGTHWGVWDTNGTMKAGMDAVFQGKTVADIWTNLSVPGGPGNPAMEFTYVPAYGSSENLTGQVWHVKPQDYAIAVYIYVNGWWTKPYFTGPLTVINTDGSFTCDITTGGIDQTATKIAAYLLPTGYNPTLASGTASVPVDVEQHAAAKFEVTRNP